MKTKMIVILLLITVGITGILSGCNSSTNTASSTKSEEKVDLIDNKNIDENYNNKEDEIKQDKIKVDDSKKVSAVTKEKETPKKLTSESRGYETINKTYNKNNVKINYPQIKNLANSEKLNSINKDLEEEALNILDDYLKDDPNLTGVTININYEVKLKNEKRLSIVYSGDSNVKGAAHPLSIFYTTNIDIEKDNSIRLSDYANINDVLGKLKDSKNIKVLSDDQELAQAQKNALLNIDDATLLNMLKDADFYKINGKIEGPEEGVYSYIVENGIVISIQVNHAIGDHAEFKLSH